jgi:hypothetical protein
MAMAMLVQGSLGVSDAEIVELTTVQLAKATGEFDYRKPPKTLRVAVDSRPLEGAGRVEDTFNARKTIACAAAKLERPFDRVCVEVGIPLLAHPRVWSHPCEPARGGSHTGPRC